MIFLILIVYSGLIITQAFGDNAFCNIDENLKIQEELIKDDAVLVEFLKIFPHANLFSANLQNANLRYADMFGANLHGTNLNYANLIGANLQGVQNLPISNEQVKKRGAIVSVD